MTKAKADITINVFIYVILLLFLLGLDGIPEKATYYPVFMLVASFVVNSLVLIGNIKNLRTETEDNTTVDNDANFLLVIVFIIFMAIYIFMMIKIGYIVSTLIFIFASLKIMKVSNKGILIFVPIILTASLYLIFTYLLIVTLPTGLLI